MISIIVCSRDKLAHKIHADHIAATIGCNHEYIGIDNTDNTYGLCGAYNAGVGRAKGEVCVFVHEDVFVITPTWGKILEDKFSGNDFLGLIGVAGTEYLFHDNPFWAAPGRPFIHGKVVHEDRDKGSLILTVFSEENNDCEAVAVDGLFFAIRTSLFQTIRFDDKTFDRFHFYDLDICMQVRKTHTINVTPDILVKHLSGGTFKDEWQTYKEHFIDKYKDMLPVSCAKEKPDPAKRKPFDSVPLQQMVNKKTFAYIKGLGQNPLMTKTSLPRQEIDTPITVVTGMHRSGTSAVSGLLSKCGFDIGPADTLLNKNEPYFDNQKGYFENTTVLQINETILRSAGGSWDKPPAADAIHRAGEHVKQHIARFARQFTGTLIKEPRLCLTLDIWRKRCSRINAIVICLRHPFSVAQSLYTRNKIPVETGLELWYDYNSRLIDSLHNMPSLVIDYDNLASNHETILCSTLRLLKQPLSMDIIKERTAGFYEANLNHHKINSEKNGRLPEKIEDLYAILKSNTLSQLLDQEIVKSKAVQNETKNTTDRKKERK